MAHGIALTWQESTSGCTYNLYRATDPGGEGSTPYQTGIATTSFQDMAGTPGQRYYYMVSAVLGGIESGLSAETSAVFPTIPAPPTNLTASPF